MTVLEYIYVNKLVQKLLKTYNKSNDKHLEDKVQDIYLILAEKQDKLQMFENQPLKNLRNYLITIIRNQYYSSTSPMYNKYNKYDNLHTTTVYDDVYVDDNEKVKLIRYNYDD